MWTKEQIAKIIKEYRIKSGLTQKQVSEIIKRLQQTIASWETGKSQPDANTLFVLFNAFGASIDEAFGFTSAKSPIVNKISRLDKGDLGKAESYIDGLLSSPEYEGNTEEQLA